MVRAGSAVVTLTAHRWEEAGAPVGLEPEPGEEVVGAGTLGSHPALFAYDPRPLWHLLGQDWDVIDLHEEPFALATAEILLLRGLRGQKAPYALYSAQNIRKIYPVPFRWMERWALRHASAVHVCNDEAGRICADKGFPGAPRTIPLGVDLEHFTTDDPPIKRLGPIVGSGVPTGSSGAGRRGVVGYAGRLAAHKGVVVLLDAVATDARLTLRLAGAGPLEAELRQRVDNLGIADRVEFLGALDQAALPGFYRSLDVLAVPSLTTPSWVEQFGRVAVEAMACGVPVVASDSGALPDVVGGAGLLVPPGDVRALAAALRSVVSDQALSDRLRAEGLSRARSCAWDRVAEQYLDLYGTMRRRSLPEADGGRPVEVVLVAYGSPALVRRALEPVRSLPVTVVDNSSLPEIAALCEELGCRYIDPHRNGGFAAGVNIGLAARTDPGSDVLLLNPDAEVDVESIRRLQSALHADPDLASVAPTQVDGEGRPSRVGWPFPSPAATWLEAVGLASLLPRTQYVIGSVLLLRAEALAQVGGLDERFFLYAEETDWAYRAHLLGWRHALVQQVSAVHLGAATSSDTAKRDAHFHASQERYMRKHYGAIGWHLARAGEVLGAAVRSVLLPGERGRAARRRAAVFARGPVHVEASFGQAA
ncbi:Glycosyltransferase involved in cell wall bisynthesis [Raineyella antarctica]|uniref:Glycosyltransferase involved in cell wall bisynthesis n=2 Tax=Raineyella antarctica TaxID=1577474 RepID=A0A1G6GDF3_9ACTN|nr:Glycosyltransferase involved in cell wall bisynthesis [Raineyella antarctica]